MEIYKSSPALLTNDRLFLDFYIKELNSLFEIKLLSKKNKFFFIFDENYYLLISNDTSELDRRIKLVTETSISTNTQAKIHLATVKVNPIYDTFEHNMREVFKYSNLMTKEIIRKDEFSFDEGFLKEEKFVYPSYEKINFDDFDINYLDDFEKEEEQTR